MNLFLVKSAILSPVLPKKKYHTISEMNPGKTEYSSRKGKKSSPAHKIETREIFSSNVFCGNCHNEKSPYDVWVKATQKEFVEGPYDEAGYECQTCHMPKAKAKTSSMGTEYNDTRLHLFNGAHDDGKVQGTIELRVYSDVSETVPGDVAKINTTLFNQKTGHKFPTGSVEDRIVWLHVEAEDAEGNKYHLKVDKKGFEGEEYTIASDVKAYQDMGVPLDVPDFEGVQREDVPVGDRIFRMPYFDPQGRMTIQQWNTASLSVDYLFGPRETKMETFTFNIPFEAAPGEMKIYAELNYRKLVKPVAEYLGVPEEARTVKVNEATTTLNILP